MFLFLCLTLPFLHCHEMTLIKIYNERRYIGMIRIAKNITEAKRQKNKRKMEIVMMTE